MSDRVMLAGQLYRVTYTTYLRDQAITLVIERELIVIGRSEEDVRQRFQWVVDISDCDFYRIDDVRKEPDRYIVIRSQSRCVSTDIPDAVIERATETTNVWQKASGVGGKKYKVYAATTCFAVDEHHAQKKLRKRVADQVELVTITAEEIYGGDDFAKPKDVSVFPRAHIIHN